MNHLRETDVERIKADIEYEDRWVTQVDELASKDPYPLTSS